MTSRLSQLSFHVSTGEVRHWQALLLAFVLTLLATGVFAITFAITLVHLNAGRIVPGTLVAGVPLGGLDRASAEARLREQLPSLSTGHLSVRIGSVEQQIGYDEIGRDYDMATMLDQAFAFGRADDVMARAQEELRAILNGASVEPRVRWNEAELERRIMAIAGMAQKAPIDATISRDGGRFVVQPSAEGVSVDANAAWQQALRSVGTLSPADGVVSVNPVAVTPLVTTAQAQLAVDRAERVAGADLVLTDGADDHTLTAETIRGWIALEASGPGAWNIVLERQPVAQFVAQLSASVYKAPIDASFKFQDDQPVAVPGSNGRELDVEATTDAVYAALTGRAEGAPVANLALTVNSVEPNLTTPEAIALAPQVRKISSWTTPYVPSERNFFGANIQIPTRLIDGTVVAPGATFDFWATVGNLADLPGIGLGGAIINGRTNPTGALGGGICSVSTTLFNAALRAGLEIGDRRYHAYYINRYPTGLDATVWRSGSATQNMTWTNDTPYPIIVRGINHVGRSGATVTFQLWTVPINRTVRFSHPIIESIKVAGDFIRYTNKNSAGKPLAPGATIRLEYPTNAFQSWVTRTVSDANGTIIHRETYYSKYVRVDGLTLVGWQEGDPPLDTTIENPNPLTPIQPPEARR